MSHDDKMREKIANLVATQGKPKEDNPSKEDSSNVTIHVQGDWFSGDQNQIAHISRGSDGRVHKDDSAERQGRKPIGERKAHDVVDPKYMTPKEYRNFKAGFWDGIETRTGAQNWEAYEWPQSPNFDNAPERREDERRTKKKMVRKNKRAGARRKIDKISIRNEAILYYSGIGLGYAVLLVAFSATIVSLM